MTQRTMFRTVSVAAATLVMASVALEGCDRNDNTPVVVNPPANTDTGAEQRARDMQADAARGMNQAGETMRETGRDVVNATKDAADKASVKVNDALITTTVNTELAKDPTLSSLKIDVDTDAGRVALKGTAPNATALGRATQIASGVKGVVSVDNQLQVEKQ